MRLPLGRRYAPAATIAVAALLPLAAAGAAQASVARPVPSLPGDYQVTATMQLNVNAGATVTIKGGGGGTSNCTTDETSTTVKVTASPVNVPFGFTAKKSGSCFFESSWSNFVVTVKNAEGKVVAYRTIQLRGYAPVNPYKISCTAGDAPAENLNCRVIDDREVALYQTGGQLGGGGGGLKSNGFETGRLSVITGGPGPSIQVKGGGGGPDGSVCTTNETDKTVPAGPDPTEVTYGFEVKASGSCAFEASYSYFTVKLLGTAASGQPATGTARILLAEDVPTQKYSASCVVTSPSVTCQPDGPRGLLLIFSGHPGLRSSAQRGK
jgi:hypothetical protein